MSYPGFCEKYGKKTMLFLTCITPQIIYIDTQVVRSAPIELLHGTSLIINCAVGVGFLAATFAHQVTNHVIQRKNIGLTKGAKIVRGVQAVAYAIPVSVALAFNALSNPDQKDLENAENDVVDRVELVNPDSVRTTRNWQEDNTSPVLVIDSKSVQAPPTIGEPRFFGIDSLQRIPPWFGDIAFIDAYDLVLFKFNSIQNSIALPFFL